MRLDLRALERGPLATSTVVRADDPGFAGLEFALTQPVTVSGRLMDSGAGKYYWHARLVTQVAMECRRCLAPTAVKIDAGVEALFTEDELDDDPAAYRIPPRAMEIELGEAIREELVLAVPEFTLCREDCRGICPRCGTDLNVGSCACRPEPDARWATLGALKPRGPDDQR